MSFTLTDAPARITVKNDPQPILRIVRGMSRVSAPLTIEVPLSTGEMFHADGKVQRVPRGEVDARFVRRVGTVNNCTVEPIVPMRVPMRSVRVPKGIGAIVVIDWATFVAEQVATSIKPGIEWLTDLDRRLTAMQDVELAEQTAAATQFQPQPAAERLRAVAMTRNKTATSAARKSTIIRAFSRR